MKRLRERFTGAESAEKGILAGKKVQQCGKCTGSASARTALCMLFMAVVLSLSACGNSAGAETADVPETVQEAQGEWEASETEEREEQVSKEQQIYGSEEEIPEPEERQIRETEARQAPSPGQSEYAIKERGLDQIVGSYETEPVLEIPEYSGAAYIAVNDNNPFFTKSNLPTESFEYYSELDELGRCGVVCANIGQDIMPTEERGDIGQIKPSGWQTVKYDFVDGKYLYNRCHLIGYQLSAENANEKNLITGTRYMNVTGMLPFENMVADYVKETGNHVLYRVSPIFDGDDLVACGVLMEGWSVEDAGEGICFNVFVYNVQPGIVINYVNGDSYVQEDNAETEPAPAGTDYILNTNSKKFHYPDCHSVKQMAEKNKQSYTGNREDIIAMGYTPCGNCNP